MEQSFWPSTRHAIFSWLEKYKIKKDFWWIYIYLSLSLLVDDDEKGPALMDELLQKINFSSSSSSFPCYIRGIKKKDVVHTFWWDKPPTFSQKTFAPYTIFRPSLHRRLCTVYTGGEREMGGRNKKMMMMEGATEGLSRYCIYATPLKIHAWMATIHMRVETKKKKRKKNQNELIFRFLSVWLVDFYTVHIYRSRKEFSKWWERETLWEIFDLNYFTL